MTLGAAPELLVLGYLRNQRLVDASTRSTRSPSTGTSTPRRSRRAPASSDFDEQAPRSSVVTTGCGQGTVFGGLMDELDGVRLPAGDRRAHQPVRALRIARRHRASRTAPTSRPARCTAARCSAHSEMLIFVEDVGRHNAIDTIAGWMWLHGDARGGDKMFYTTGRLTSEMVIKSAQMGMPIIVSRNGVTQMGHELAERLGMTLFGRAAEPPLHLLLRLRALRCRARATARRA